MCLRSGLLLVLPLLALLAPFAGCGDGQQTGGSSSAQSSSGTGPDLGNVDDIMLNLPQSCAFECNNCAEPMTPFSCPTIKPWAELPHDDACANWDGAYPAPTQGQCTASAPTGEAARKAGPIPGGLVLPDGHRIIPAGREVVFQEADLAGGFPMSILAMPGTHFALVSDGGLRDNALRLIDINALAGALDPVASYVPFPPPSSLFYGIEFLPPGRALASGGGDGVIYAFDVDTNAGTLKKAPTRDIQLGVAKGTTPYYSGAIAATGDGQKLLVAPSEYGLEVPIYSLADATYGKKLGAVPLSSHALYDLKLNPFDPTGTLFYASEQSTGQILEIDSVSAKVTRALPLGKNPEQIVFLDATYAAVTETDSDDISLVNLASFVVETKIPVFEAGAPHGFSPTALAYDPTSKRLYAALAGVNAVEAYDVTSGAPPKITPVGRIPTAWWPTGVMVHSDGSLVIVNGKAHGTGTDNKQYPWGDGAIVGRMHGSVQRVPAASLVDLTAASATVEAGRSIGSLPGRSTITCPPGVSDFPVPLDSKSGPSSKIKHVILVVRENKTYDAVFGDRPDLGDGDPKLIMASDPMMEAKIWANARSIAQGFTNFDNFYTDAEQSIQGHTWTVYGRTTDYMERTWLNIWGRGTRPLTTPTGAIDAPAEGGIFAWLQGEKIDFDNMGEIIGNAALDSSYQGLLYAQNRPDVDKSCYIGGRLRLRCDLKPFTYALQTNDHTYGGQAGSAAPEVMIAVNDEAAGILLDALSHSPYWKDSLLIVTEDDPQDGGDHVDLHRSLLFMASPWIKRGYVSHGHYDMASVYKLVAHIFGIPYHNEMIKDALLPADPFTSTPDYTPYSYIPRTITAPCNPSGSPAARVAEGWDFEDLDDQPGLSEQIMEMMKESPKERGVTIVR